MGAAMKNCSLVALILSLALPLSLSACADSMSSPDEDRVQSLELEVVAGCHTPVIRKSQIDQAFTMIRRIPDLEPPPQPCQPDLEELMHCVATGKQYVWEPPAPPGA